MRRRKGTLVTDYEPPTLSTLCRVEIGMIRVQEARACLSRRLCCTLPSGHDGSHRDEWGVYDRLSEASA